VRESAMAVSMNQTRGPAIEGPPMKRTNFSEVDAPWSFDGAPCATIASPSRAKGDARRGQREAYAREVER
jgi:hypothetical protein